MHVAAKPAPNPSLKRSANGRPPGPVWRYAVHFRQPGPGVLPSSPLSSNVRRLTGSQNSNEIMNNTQTLMATLEGAPDIIIGLVREVTSQNLKRRPSPNKWSAHEHACHIPPQTGYQAQFF